MKTTLESSPPREQAARPAAPQASSATPAATPGANRALIALVLLLAAALVGLGAWTIVDRGDGGSEAQGLWDDALAAWSSHDRDAIESLYAPDAQLRTVGPRGGTFTGNKAIGAFAFFFDVEGIELARVSDVASTGELGVSFGRQTTTMGGPPETVLNVIQVRAGRIARQWSFWLGTSPFDNVLAK